RTVGRALVDAGDPGGGIGVVPRAGTGQVHGEKPHAGSLGRRCSTGRVTGTSQRDDSKGRLKRAVQRDDSKGRLKGAGRHCPKGRRDIGNAGQGLLMVEACSRPVTSVCCAPWPARDRSPPRLASWAVRSPPSVSR